MSALPKLKPVRRRKPGRPPQHLTEDLRDLYLQAALEAFLANGYERTSIEAIARIAKAGKMTLYRLYGSKEELFERVVQLAIERAHQTLKTDPGAYRSAREGLRALVQHLYEAFTAPMMIGVHRLVIAEGSRFPALKHAMLQHERELMAPVEEFLRLADGRGLLRIPDAHAGAYQLVALASGGGRFLIHEPLRSTVAKRAWVDAVTEFAWRSWKVTARPASRANNSREHGK